MIRWKIKIKKIQSILIDIVCFVIANIFALHFYKIQVGTLLFPSKTENLLLIIITILVLSLSHTIFKIYEETIKNSKKISTLIKTNIIIILSMLVTKLIFNLLEVNSITDQLLLYYTLLICVLVTMNRIIFAKLFTSDNKRIIILGYSKRGVEYLKNISNHKYLNMEIIGYVDTDAPCYYDDLDHLGGIDDLISIVQAHTADEITVAISLKSDNRIEKSLNECQRMGVTITMLLECNNQADSLKAQVAMVGDLPALKFHTVSLDETQLFMKRVFDIIGASVGMLIFAIAYLIFAPLIKFESKGPAIFKQTRVGRNGRKFQMQKFRSMEADAEAKKEALAEKNEMDGPMFKMDEDPRITRIGKFIRKTSIDELPQFWNVLKGEMSLVGTRPPTVEEVEQYELSHRRRIAIVPGITGNWQVQGRSNIKDFEEIVQMDIDYIENWSVKEDIKILFKTVLVVLKKEGSK